MDAHYNIKIDKQVHNFNEGFDLLFFELKKLHTWERSFMVAELLKKGFSIVEIANLLHINRKQLYAQGYRSLRATTGSPSLACGESRMANDPPAVAKNLNKKKGEKQNDKT
ncbi:hypothetical protein IJJ27_01205 [bacterium]|nr:hypothetical protein [bacterium]